MPGTFLGFPFDEELFSLNWQNAVDPTRAALIASGAIAQSSEIRNLIACYRMFWVLILQSCCSVDKSCLTLGDRMD